ncbi:8353_t:CDS:2, partial [Gigaspora rosea]
AITITHPNKRKQQLKAARAKKKSHVPCDYEDYEDLVWSDQDIHDRAFDYFAVLLTPSKNWKPSSRPSTYVGGSKRPKRHKKAELKKAAQDTQLITTYFAPALTCESSTELHTSMEVESIEMELIEVEPVDVESVESVESMEPVEVDERTKMRLAIEELDGMLKKDDNKMDNGVRGDYKAQCIGAW